MAHAIHNTCSLQPRYVQKKNILVNIILKYNYVYARAHTNARTQTNINSPTQTPTHTRTRMYTRTHAHTHSYMHTQTTDTRTRARTCTHARTYHVSNNCKRQNITKLAMYIGPTHSKRYGRNRIAIFRKDLNGAILSISPCYIASQPTTQGED